MTTVQQYESAPRANPRNSSARPAGGIVAPPSATASNPTPVPPKLIRTPAAAARAAIEDAAASRRTRMVLRLIFGTPSARPFAVRLWNGISEPHAGPEPPRFTLVLNRPSVLREMFMPPTQLRLAEAFIDGAFDSEGDLESACAVETELSGQTSSPFRVARIMSILAGLPHTEARTMTPRRIARWRMGAQHSRDRDAAAIRAHYDAGNDFYALWLGRRMLYSSAYFEAGNEDLDTAQEAKLELICRKLRLQPGDRLLDVGCGWGGLITYAAAKHGVHALGITLSEAQAAIARQRIAAADLAGRCSVEVRDYRSLGPDQQFDKVVSVGMFEHVGRHQLPAYAHHIWRLTAPNGLFLNCGIVTAPEAPGLRAALVRHLRREGAFIDRYVFPDGELVRLDEIVGDGEAAGFETRDVESHREHYARTLRQWVRRLESAEAEAVRLVGARLYRIWRLYMAASAHAFASGRLGTAQVLFAKPGDSGVVSLPPTREDLYLTRPTSVSPAPPEQAA
jgi:cyclopropane-fatty-acyl-phospholipid synthase